MAVAMYTTVFAISPGLLGLSFQDGLFIRIVAIDPDALESAPSSEFTSRAKNETGYALLRGKLGEFTIDTNLDEGEHRVDLPLAFAGLEKLLVVGPYAKVQEAACAAIFEVYSGVAPGSHRLRVLPQKWFNRDEFDLGYEWITRAARDPHTGRVVGDGIRLPGAFLLKEDGCRIDRWIKAPP